MDKTSLIVLETFYNRIEAHIVKTKLESEGIDSTLHDDTMMSVLPLQDEIFGGVKLLVREEDFEKALEILQSVSEIDDDFEEEEE